ncbi:growth hormone secretagogue receptor type 1-like [Lineus longissimus]|uniref:growth hormone secretagogue receptor type 1-like n=1 Tax=Lineus longissimus TaxID=88925 RepID=UPI002B4E4554
MNSTSVHGLSQQEDFSFIKSILLALTKYLWTIPVVLGVPGNILTILVARQKHNRKMSPCVYMTAMAVSDTAFLLDVTWYYSLFYQGHLDAITDVKARKLIIEFHIFIMFTLAKISGLYLAAMSVDRLIAVRFPMAAIRLCTTKRAKVTVLLITIPIVLINIHIFFVFKYVEDLNSGVRIILYDDSVSGAVEKVFSTYMVIVGTGLPFSIILGANLLIIITVKRASFERAKLNSNTSRAEKEERNQQHLTILLLFISFAYVVTTLPYRLYDPILKLPQIKAIYDMTQQYWKLRYTLGIFFTANLWFYNYAVNFYLYCIGGGKRYRDDTKAVIGQLFPCCK